MDKEQKFAKKIVNLLEETKDSDDNISKRLEIARKIAISKSNLKPKIEVQKENNWFKRFNLGFIMNPAFASVVLGISFVLVVNLFSNENSGNEEGFIYEDEHFLEANESEPPKKDDAQKEEVDE